MGQVLNEQEREAVFRFTDAILHGDHLHRQWLMEAAGAFAVGDQIPEERPQFKYSRGDRVVKCTGRYHLSGTVLRPLVTLAGDVRFVVEHDPLAPGLLHIYSEENLRPETPDDIRGEAGLLSEEAARELPYCLILVPRSDGPRWLLGAWDRFYGWSLYPGGLDIGTPLAFLPMPPVPDAAEPCLENKG